MVIMALSCANRKILRKSGPCSTYNTLTSNGVINGVTLSINHQQHRVITKQQR